MPPGETNTKRTSPSREVLDLSVRSRLIRLLLCFLRAIRQFPLTISAQASISSSMQGQVGFNPDFYVMLKVPVEKCVVIGVVEPRDPHIQIFDV